MHRHQRQQHIKKQDMHIARGAAGLFAHQAVEIAVVEPGVFIGGKQTGEHLHQKRRQKCEHHQRAERIVAGLLVFAQLPAQIAPNLRRPFNKLGKARGVAAPKAPTQAKHHQAQNKHAAAQMPRHQIAARFAAIPHKSQREHQQPVKKPRGRIPYFQFLLGHVIYFRCVLNNRPPGSRAFLLRDGLNAKACVQNQPEPQAYFVVSDGLSG